MFIGGLGGVHQQAGHVYCGCTDALLAIFVNALLIKALDTKHAMISKDIIFSNCRTAMCMI